MKQIPVLRIACLFGLLLVVPHRLFAYNWPFKEAGVFTKQQKIRATLGAYRVTNRFHRGVDIVPNDASNTKVYVIEAGQVRLGYSTDGLEEYLGRRGRCS